MPSPRRRSRDRRSRSRSPHRRPPPRRSRSRSPRRRPVSRSPHRRPVSRSPRRRPVSRSSRSRSPPPKRRSPRRSRTHSPGRRPVRRSRSRSRNRRSFSPGQRVRRSQSPRGRPDRRQSPRRSPGRRRQGGKQLDERRRRLSHSPVEQRGSRSPHQESPSVPKNSSHTGHRDRSPLSSPGKPSSSNLRHKTNYISGVTVVTPIRRLLLSDRFESEEQKKQGDIVIEDNIVIAIQRGPHAKNASPHEINRDFDPNNVVLIRQPDEGQKAIFDREEIKAFGFDAILDENVYEEKRIISVVPSASSQQSLSRRVRSPEVIRKFQHGPEIKLDFRPDPRYEPLMKSERKEDNYLEETRIKRLQKNPNDLRHSLSKRRGDDDARRRIEAKRRDSDSKKMEGGSVLDRIGDHSRERRRDGSRERRVDRSGRGRGRDQRKASGDRHDKEKRLPDFKNRPDKFQYDEWKEKPEMIPRNPSYFEHDNREGDREFRGRGRGRGFRGRPPPRGRGRDFRGRSRGGFSRPREKESTWKHDLFDKLNEEEEEKPSSTTKN